MNFWIYQQLAGGGAGANLLANKPGNYNAPARLLQVTSNVAANPPGIALGGNYLVWSNPNQTGQPDRANCQNVAHGPPTWTYSFSVQ